MVEERGVCQDGDSEYSRDQVMKLGLRIFVNPFEMTREPV